jgi:CheY-like chemotaxis protein
MKPILVIEDDISQCNWLQAVLASKGFEVEIARDGQEGLRRLAEKDYALAIVDLILPITSGFEVLAALQDRKSTVPILISSSIVIPEVHHYLKIHPNVKILSKPHTPEGLLEAVEELLELKTGQKMERDAESQLDFADRERFLEVRFEGLFTVDRFKHLIDAAFALCEKRKARRLLVDARELTGELTSIDRYDIGQHAAQGAKMLERAVMVAPPALIDTNKFGVRVARNRGLRSNVFADRQDAIEWLLAETDPFV